MTALDALRDMRDKIARALATARAEFEGKTEHNVIWEYWSPQTQALFLYQADAVLAVLDADRIDTAEELKALPVGSVILSSRGTVAHKQNASETPWVLADDAREYWTNIGLIDCLTWPFTVLHQPEGEEQ